MVQTPRLVAKMTMGERVDSRALQKRVREIGREGGREGVYWERKNWEDLYTDRSMHVRG